MFCMDISQDFRIGFTYNYKSEKVLDEDLLVEMNLVKLLTCIPIIGSIVSAIFLINGIEKKYVKIRFIIALFPVVGGITLLSIDIAGTILKLIVDAKNEKKAANSLPKA